MLAALHTRHSSATPRPEAEGLATRRLSAQPPAQAAFSGQCALLHTCMSSYAA